MRLLKPYRKAKLVEGTYRWYIEYYSENPTTKVMQRFRETYDLNRIHDVKERRKEGLELVRKINLLLPQGFPFVEIAEKEEEPGMKLVDAIEMIRKLKCNTDRKETARTYKSTAKLFVEWLEMRGLKDMQLVDFSRRLAQEYMDYWVIDRGVRSATYNGKLSHIKTFFNDLRRREYIDKNPFEFIKNRKKQKKLRTAFTDEQRAMIAEYYKKYDPWMYKSLLLLFYCWIRPGEQRRMTFSCFDYRRGIIVLPEDVTKTGTERVVTIPKVILSEFTDKEFTKYPTNYYCFGNRLKPGRKMCGKHSMNGKHRKVLEKLGIREEGLSLYSWKDDGMTILQDFMKPHEVKNHAGHSSFVVTEKYLHREQVIDSVRNIPERFL